MKIAIYYDTLTGYGGAERLVLQTAQLLKADIITAGYNKKISKWINKKIKIIDIGNSIINFSKPLGVLIESPLRFYLNRNNFKYDINIFLGSTSIFGANKKNKNIWYCLSPNRLLYDQDISKLKGNSILKIIFIYLYKKIFLHLDQNIIKNNFDKIIAQTKYIRKKIHQVYDINSDIVYPFIDTEKYHFKSLDDFFLTVGRLYPEKRIDIIAEAFKRMPDKKLIIVGDGPEKVKIQNIIKKTYNITLLSNISEERLIDLYSRCIATIYIPINEDFGLIPIESMASGKPCIASNEGGCKETIIQNKTGFLIIPKITSLISFINKIKKENITGLKSTCLQQSREFNSFLFKQKIQKILMFSSI